MSKLKREKKKYAPVPGACECPLHPHEDNLPPGNQSSAKFQIVSDAIKLEEI